MTKQAALYLRLSRDDEKGGESESIKNQREFLKNYCKGHGIVPIYEFADDGFSGTSFSRPAFSKMIEQIKRGEIDTVLTKDLSRLGRDYIKTGYYIEEFFPLYGVRFIAVNDMIDTGAGGYTEDLLPFRAVLNDMYAKDISKKVRASLTTKKLAGEFIGASAPYGYKKADDNRNRLIPDEEVRGNVERIFAEFLSGKRVGEIAKMLTDSGIPTPSLYKKSKRYAESWSGESVRNILKNPTYAGHLTQNTARKLSYKLEKRIKLKCEEWIVVKNTHEPIISERDFERTAELLRGAGKAGRMLSGRVFCGGCGAKMGYMHSGGREYLVCSRWRRNTLACRSHCIRADFVEAEWRRAAAEGAENIIIGAEKEIIWR